jgi:hypothetical protein
MGDTASPPVMFAIGVPSLISAVLVKESQERQNKTIPTSPARFPEGGVMIATAGRGD